MYNSMEWFSILFYVVTAVFVVQFLLSVFGGGHDVDTDSDAGDVSLGDSFTFSDVVSFKGAIHFLLGFSLTLHLMGFNFLSSGIGVIVGIVFVLVLFFLYKWLYSTLQQSITYQTKLENVDATVYYWDKKTQTGAVQVSLEGRIVEVPLRSSSGNDFSPNEIIKVSGSRSLVFNV